MSVDEYSNDYTHKFEANGLTMTLFIHDLKLWCVSVTGMEKEPDNAKMKWFTPNVKISCFENNGCYLELGWRNSNGMTMFPTTVKHDEAVGYAKHFAHHYAKLKTLTN